MSLRVNTLKLLFDKVIKVELISTSNVNITGTIGLQNELTTSTKDTIQTPKTGRKPLISVRGTMSGKTEMQNIELRMTNLYTSKPLSDYKALKVTAGYKDGNQAEVYGTIMNAYVENPPPDSVTVFEVITGDLQKWSTAWINKTYDKNTKVESIFRDMAKILGVDLIWKIKTESVTAIPINFNSLVQDSIFKMKKSFPNFVVRPDYKGLHVSDEKEGTGVTHKLNYVKSAKKDAAGFVIVAPWNPAIRPMDIVELDPQYYKQSFGGQNITNNKFVVITLDFEFDTMSNNSMNIRTTELQQ
jgi:hypothetical protein